MSADVQVPPVDEPLTPPFGGAQIWEPAIDAVYPYIERMSLLVGRWGFKKGELAEAEYRKLLDGRAQAQFERLMRENKIRRLFVPRAAVAWHSCRRAMLLSFIRTAAASPSDRIFLGSKSTKSCALAIFSARRAIFSAVSR